jgi:hypothetical protein
VNDRIDFVVTLGGNGAKSSGRLERQTAGSTVAIREIEAESCEAVADVLAFTLTLTLNPATDVAPPSAPLPVAPVPAPAPTPPPAATAQAPSERPAATGDEQRVDGVSTVPTTKVPDPRWLLGADLGALTGPTSALGPWLGVFGERRLGLAAFPGSSVRLTALLSRVEDQQAELAFSTAAGRLEGCPVAVGGPTLDVRPCLGFELGYAMAEGLSSNGRDDDGAWFASNLLWRLSWRAAASLALSVEAGATLPFIRYSFASESGEMSYQTDPIGFFAAVGGALSLP